MRSLFTPSVAPADIPEIAGLQYVPEYLTVDDERALVAAIDHGVWDTSWDRRRQPFGAAYGHGKEAAVAIPDWGQSLAERLLREGRTDLAFDQMLVNEYLPGQGIALHLDYEPFDRTVASISLLSPCVMDFCEVATQRRESLLLEPRSLLILSDDARYAWQHGIARRKNDVWQGLKVPRARRLSLTFRTLKKTR